MQRSTLITLGASILIIALIVISYMVASERQAASVGAQGAASLRGQSLFADGEYGFTLAYPEADEVSYTFESYYHVPSAWRVGALANASGTPIISIVGYRTKSENTYPRYFDAEVRIGASNDPHELARCLTASSEQGEKALSDVSLGSTTFKAFSFEQAGMMQYAKGVSYRALHDGSCIAVEQLQTGANYRDDPVSPHDIPDSELQAKYDALEAIVKTFTFVNR